MHLVPLLLACSLAAAEGDPVLVLDEDASPPTVAVPADPQTVADTLTELRALAAEADALELHGYDPRQQRFALLFSLADPAAAGELLATVAVDADPVDWNPDLARGPEIVLLREGSRLAVLKLVEGRTLRRLDHAQPEIVLTTAAEAAFAEWFAGRGFPGLTWWLRQREGARQERAALRAAARAALPPAAQEVIDAPPARARREDDVAAHEQALGERLARAVGDDHALVLAVCGVLGAPGRAWSSLDDLERRLIAAAAATAPEAFTRVVDAPDSPAAAMVGAARLAFWHGFAERLPAEGREERLAALATAALAQGDPAVAEAVVRRIGARAAALGGPCCGPGEAAPLAPAARAVLREVAAGRLAAAMPTTAVGIGPRALALLLLALDGDPAIAPLLDSEHQAGRPPADRHAIATARALAGDPVALRREAFAADDALLAQAAIAACERFGGAHGLDLLVGLGLRHADGSVRRAALAAFVRITGHEVGATPDGEPLAVVDAIDGWWRDHGAAFVGARAAP